MSYPVLGFSKSLQERFKSPFLAENVEVVSEYSDKSDYLRSIVI